MAAVILQCVCVSSAFLAVGDEEPSREGAGRFRRKVVLLGEAGVGLTLTLFACTLPLILRTGDAYYGLSAESFFGFGLPLGILTAALCAVAAFLLNGRLFRGDGFAVDEKSEGVYLRNHRLKRNCALAFAALILATAFINGEATGFGDAGRVAEGTRFDDLEAFKAFMEQEVPAEEAGVDSKYGADAPVQDSAATWYDFDGNMISEDEALTRTIDDADGNVLCTFIHRNQAVSSWTYGYRDGELTSLTVFTQAQYRSAWQKIEAINAVFMRVYFAELAALIFCYFRKRAK